MSYLVVTRKTFDTPPENDAVFTEGAVVDKWNDFTSSGKLISIETNKISDTIYEDTMYFDSYWSWEEFRSLFDDEKAKETESAVTVTVVRRG